MKAPDRRITVAAELQLGGVRFDRLRGVAIGFDECDQAVETIDLLELNEEQRVHLKQRLEAALLKLERRGATRLH